MDDHASFELPGTGTLTIASVEPWRTYELRQAVLRPHQSREEMASLDSTHPEAAVVAAVVEATGEVVSTAAVFPEQAPEALAPLLADGAHWRLRGMATREDLRGSGVGAAVLSVALSHVSRHGGVAVWCNARVGARSFYERAGFATFGAQWVDPLIGPHVVMWRQI